VLPARILDFEQLAETDLDQERVSTPIEARAARFATEIRRGEQQLAQFVRAVLTDGRVEFYEVEVGLQTDTAQVVACYKPRLAAAVAECLDDTMKARFCPINSSYVTDSALERALLESGIVRRVRSVKAERPSTGKTGEYYLIPKDALGTAVRCKETLTLAETS